MGKLRADTNSRLKNYCSQKNLSLILHDDVKENLLGVKKLHLNRKSNSVFTKNLLRVVEFLIMNEICFVKRIACLRILLFHNQMWKRLLRILISNMNKLIFGHLNINSLRNKFDLLSEEVKGSIDILMVSETKFDGSFS